MKLHCGRTWQQHPWGKKCNLWEHLSPSRRVRIEVPCANRVMGRFGGGWDWEFGFQVGASTVIVNLLLVTIRLQRKRMAA